MAGDVRQRMAAGAAMLLAKQGLQATSFSSVLALTGTPRGSVYHHFPDGKDQLVSAAMDAVSGRTMDAMEAMAGRSAQDIAEAFLALWRDVLVRSQLRAGCAMLAVTVATESAELLAQAGTVFRDWRTRLTELLEEGGLSTTDAPRCAALLIAGSEGAVVMSRAEQSLDPFEMVADQLLAQVRSLLVDPVSGHDG